MKKREVDWAAQKRRADRHEASLIKEIVNNMLRYAVELNAERILIRKRPSHQGPLREDSPGYSDSDGGRLSYFTIEYEIGENTQEVGSMHIEQWHRLISRLKVVANTIDYGLRKSASSTFSFDLDDSTAANFLLTTNPDPSSDSEVVLEVK